MDDGGAPSPSPAAGHHDIVIHSASNSDGITSPASSPGQGPNQKLVMSSASPSPGEGHHDDPDTINPGPSPGNI